MPKSENELEAIRRAYGPRPEPVSVEVLPSGNTKSVYADGSYVIDATGFRLNLTPRQKAAYDRQLKAAWARAESLRTT